MSMYNKIVDLQKLNQAWQHVRKNHPACGVDDITYDEFDENKKEEIFNLHVELVNHNYKSLPVKEVTLYKGEKARNIALFCMRDKVIHQSLAYELSQMYDGQFSSSTYAYRPGKSALNAINEIEQAVQRYEWVLKLDIVKFFDSINQGKMKEILRRQIREDDVLMLLDEIMQAKTLNVKTGELSVRRKGIYQGSGIAPVLSNIYLMEFDKILQERAKFYVRYSDDILILDNTEERLKELLIGAENILSSLDLQLQKEKTNLCRVSDGFIFLGYSFDENGKTISDKAEESLVERLETMWLTSTHLTLDEKLKKGSEILGGWEQYYRNERVAGSILEFAVLAYSVRYKDEMKEGVIRSRFQYVNEYRDLLEFFLEIWREWKVPDYERKEYEQFHQLLRYDEDISFDMDNPMYAELLETLRKFTIHKDKECYEDLIQLYSDCKCYNKAAFLQEEKNHFLELENERIFHLSSSGGDVNDYKFSIEDVDAFMSLFVGREDMYATEQIINGTQRRVETVFEALTEDVIEKHLKGQITVSSYVQRPNATASYMVFDIDVSKKILLKYPEGTSEFNQYMEKARATAVAVRKCIGQTGMQAYVEYSGYRGYHVWVFFSEWVPIRFVNLLQDLFSEKIREMELLGKNEDLQMELFPNKARVRQGKPGQCIKLPYGMHSKSCEMSYFVDKDGTLVEDIGRFLKSIAKYSLHTVKKVLSSHTSLTQNNKTNCIEENVKLKDVDMDLSAFGPLESSVQAALSGCSLMRYLCQKARKTGYLNHFERLSILYVFGHLGDEGKTFVHTVMEFTMNYQYHITEKFIKRLPEKPVSCIKLRDQYKTVTAEYGCNCNFKRTKNCYPSPVLHAIKDSDEVISNITMPMSRTLSKEKEKQVYEELNIHKKVQDMSSRIVELKKQKRGLDKSIEKIEKELEKIFDDSGVDSMEIEMGILVRRKKETGYEWLVEL